MKITFDWLKEHLDTNLKEEKLLEQLTNVGLEVESVDNLSEGLDLFKVAKISHGNVIHNRINASFIFKSISLLFRCKIYALLRR